MFLNATLDLKWVNFLQNSTQQLDMPGQPSSDFLRNSCFKCSNFPRIYCTPSLLEAHQPYFKIKEGVKITLKPEEKRLKIAQVLQI